MPVRAGPEWHSWHSRTPRLKPEKKKEGKEVKKNAGVEELPVIYVSLSYLSPSSTTSP